MAKTVISSVLDSLLGKYVDGLGGDSLQVGLWSGELVLNNLSLKPHALAELQLPITVVKGTVKRIHVVVPWNSLGSSSVQVTIEGVYALVTPNSKLPSPEEAQQAKKSQIEREELIRQHDRLAEAHNQDGEDESTFLSRLMTRIVDNLHITLRDVHLRYEDDVSNPEMPFACGLMVHSFSFHTTDAEGKEIFVDRTTKKERFLHKAVNLSWFGVYWDRIPLSDPTALLHKSGKSDQRLGDMVQSMCKFYEEQKKLAITSSVRDKTKDPRMWVIRPCNLSVRLTKNETTDFSRAAKYTVHTEVNSLVCALSREQYEDMLFLHRAFVSRRAIEMHFLSARSRPFHSAKLRPREWWDYAVHLVLVSRAKANATTVQSFNRRHKTVRLRFSTVKKARQEGRRYAELFRMQLRKGSPLDPSTKEAKATNQFERTYPVDVIMAMRDVAEDAEAIARQKKLEADKQAAATAAQTASTGSGSWYNYFFSAPPTSAGASIGSGSNKETKLEDILTAEGRANLKRAYDETVEQEKTHEVPVSCNLVSFKFYLRGGRMALYQSTQSAPFLEASLDASLTANVKPTNDWDAKCRVQQFEVTNGLAKSTPFSTFCRLGSATGSTRASPCASLDVSFSKQNDSNEPDLPELTLVHVRFNMEPVRLLADPAFINFLQGFFTSILPANQLDRVWSFATSSVSDWIFSDEEEEELYRQTMGKRTRTEFDVMIDVKAPVVVIAESIHDSKSPTVVVDFGRFQFKNEPGPQREESAAERLYWSTEMSQVKVLLGCQDALRGTTLDANAFAEVVEEFSIKFDVDSSVASPRRELRERQHSGAGSVRELEPNISATAVLPRVVMKVTEAQITALGRIHSSLQAQLLAVPHLDDNVTIATLDDPAEVTNDSETPKQAKPPASKAFKDKFAMKLSLVLGNVVLYLKETREKDAFKLLVAGTSVDMAVFTSQSVIQARLRSLVLEDCLYNEDSKFFKLLSTGNAGVDSGEEDLMSLDLTMFAPQYLDNSADAEADTVGSLKCSVLNVQWNPSSIALLYQTLSAYTTALQSHAVAVVPVPQPTIAVSDHVSANESRERPPLLIRASLVQLSVTFNKDHVNRQLVSLAIQDCGFEYSSRRAKSSDCLVYEVAGHLGNFVAVDLSLEKHPLYSPLVGLDSSVASSDKKRHGLSSLLVFSYTWSDATDERSVLKLEFEPVRVVYYHQQLMEFVDYLFEGILGAMVAETLATATRLLLAEDEGSTLFQVTAKSASLILPIQVRSTEHWKLTSNSLVLEHYPSSVIEYRGSSEDQSKRVRIARVDATASVEDTERAVFKADCKRITLANVNMFLAQRSSTATEEIIYRSVLRAPTDFKIEVDDLVPTAALMANPSAQDLPRFTVHVRMNNVSFEMNREQYLAILALVQENFGADVLTAVSTESGVEGSSRPAVSYSYSRTDLEQVTWQLVFEIGGVRCDLFDETNTAGSAHGLDSLLPAIAKPGGARRGPIASIGGAKLSASINQLRDQWPSIVVRASGLSLCDRATGALGNKRDGFNASNDDDGLLLQCEEDFELVYAWDETTKQHKVDLNVDGIHVVVIPEPLLMLLDFVSSSPEVTAPPPAPATSRRKSLTASILSDPSGPPLDVEDSYDIAFQLKGRNMAVMFAQDVYDAESEQVGMRANFSVGFSWKPSSSLSRKHAPGSSDLDIQSSLVVDATGIEVFSRNAIRQGCSGGVTLSKRDRIVQVLEPCDVHVEVSDLFPHAGLKQQIVALKFSPVELFVSYEDACVLMEVMESSTQSFGRHKTVKMAESSSIDDTHSTSLSAAATEMLEIHRYLTCDVGDMSLTFINDCDGCDMGLVQLQMQRCSLFLNVNYLPKQSASAPTASISGGGSIVTLISYYNPDTRDWHPMCSEWGLDVSVQGSIAGDDTLNTKNPGSLNELHVIVTANHALDLAVTDGLLEVIASAGGAWNRRSSAKTPSSPTGESESPRSAQKKRRAKAPCVIRNDTGLPLTFWMSASGTAAQAEAGSAVKIVASGAVADLHYVHNPGRGCGIARRYASRDRHNRGGSMRLSLHLADAPFQPVQDIEFEQLGSRAFQLLDAKTFGTTKYTLNFHSQLIDGRIVLTVSSQVKVVSQLAMPLQLLANDPSWASPVEIGVLYPHRESAVPIMASLATELRVRPLADAVYNWSAPIPIQTSSDVELRVECTSSEATKGAIFCVAMALEQSLRIVNFAEPIVLVNKLPVDLAFRVKSPLSGGRDTSGTSRGASGREKIPVGAKCGVWWTDQRHRPQFELSVSGCQTSRWIELTRPGGRGKSGSATTDVVSVMLLRQDGRPFKLLIQMVEQEPVKSLHIFFYAEIWFINRTGLDLIYGNESEAEAYFAPTNARALVGNAQIAAYSSSSESPTAGAPTVRLTMQSCGWSSRFTADPRRLSWQDECLTLKADGRRRSGGGDPGGGSNMLYEFGVSADYSTRHFGSITTLISVIPRYLVINQSPYTILLLEDSTKDGALVSNSGEAHHILARGDTYALYWVTGSRSKLRTSILGEHTDYGWSEGMSYDHVKSKTILIPEAGRGGGKSTPVRLMVSVKQGSISQASMIIVISTAVDEDEDTLMSSTEKSSWDVLTVHTQLAGLIVTLADKAEQSSSSSLFGKSGSINENVARLSISRVTAELCASRSETSAKLNVMGVKIEDLLARSKNPVVLRPVVRGDSFSSSRGNGEKCFLVVSYLEKPHAKYRWVEKLHVEVQDVRIATSMSFVDRLNNLTKETLAHFDSHAYSTTLSVFDGDAAEIQEENILEYFITTEEDTSMDSLTGRKVYLESCEIAPVRVVVSFTREKGDVRNDPSAGFWLSNLKFKIENACLTLDSFKLSHAMATQEALVESLTSFYVKSVKSQALGLIESVQVSTLVTSAVTSGVSSLMSTIIGKTDPSLASSSSQSFSYQFLTNSQLISKHSRLLEQCQTTAQFMQQIKHLVFDWDSNHTGLEARGCVALSILNNSRQSLVVNVQLNDGAEIRVLPLGRKHLASAISSTGDGGWRSDRSMVIFAWGYTPTLLTSGDVYFTVHSNACNVFATRKTARLKANMGYTATFTHQEVQSWWSTNVVIVGDDLHGHVSSTSSGIGSSLFGESSSLPASSPAMAQAPVPLQPSETGGMLDDEYEVVFTSPSLGIIAKQSGARAVIVRECLRLSDGTPSAALACGKIAHGDTILTVNGVGVTNTNQFRDLVSGSSRPVVLRFRRTGERFNSNEAYDLFGEKQPRPAPRAPPAAQSQSEDDDFDLFGTRG